MDPNIALVLQTQCMDLLVILPEESQLKEVIRLSVNLPICCLRVSWFSINKKENHS